MKKNEWKRLLKGIVSTTLISTMTVPVFATNISNENLKVAEVKENSLEEQLFNTLVDGYNAVYALFKNYDYSKSIPKYEIESNYEGCVSSIAPLIEEYNTLEKARQYLKQYLTAASAEGVLYRAIQRESLYIKDDILYCAVDDTDMLFFDLNSYFVGIEQQSEDKIVAKVCYKPLSETRKKEKQIVFIKQDGSWKLSYDEYNWF